MTKFSQNLQKLLSTSKPITLRELIFHFREKSFSVLFLILLAIPALPLPTGGITHIFELIAIFISLELIIGRQSLWLPKSWLNKNIPASLQAKGLPKFIKLLSWVEKYSRPRLNTLIQKDLFLRLTGVAVLIYSIFALIAPPFTGLDRLPALGVVLLSLGIIFEDIIIYLAGIILGSLGIVVVLMVGKLAFQLI